MDLGKFFGDVGKNIGNFFGWNQSEDEKRRKAEEARQRAEQQRQQQQQQKATQTPMGGFTVPTLNTQPSTIKPQQQTNTTVAQPKFDTKQIEDAARKIAEGGAGSPYSPELLEAAKPRVEELKKQKRLTDAKESIKKEIRNGGNPNLGGANLLLNPAGGGGLSWQERQEAIQQANADIAQERKVAEQKTQDYLKSTLSNGRTVQSLIDEYDKNTDLTKRANYRAMIEKAAADPNNPKYQLASFLKPRLGLNFQENASNVFNAIGDFTEESNKTFLGLGGVFEDEQGLTPLEKSKITFKDGKLNVDTMNEAERAAEVERNKNAASTAGRIAGTVQDLATIIVPGAVAEKAITKLPQFAKWASQGTKAQKFFKSMTPIVAGGAVSSTVGQATDPSQNAAENYATGAAFDFLLGAGGAAFSRIFSKLRAGEALNDVENAQLGKLMEDQGVESVEDLTKKGEEFIQQNPERQQTPEVEMPNSRQQEVPTQESEVIQVINPDGSKSFYRIPTSQRDDIVNLIDNNRDTQGMGGFAGLPTDTGTWHITARTPEDMAGRGFEDAGVLTREQLEETLNKGTQNLASQADEAQSVIDDVSEQAAQQAQGGQRGINAEEVMANLRERSRVYNEADPATRAEINQRAASQTNPDDVTFDTPYAREAVYADLQAAGLSPQDITNLSNRYQMTAGEWRTVLNATGDLSKARNLAALMDSQIKKVLGKQAAQPAAEVIDTAAGRTNTATGEIVDEAPRATSTYENNIQEVRSQMETILRNADEALQESGSSWEQLSRKIQAADRSGTAPQLTDVEARAYGIVRQELDNILQEAGQAGRLSEDVGMREFYLPQARKDSVQIPETMEDIYNTGGFGYAQARQNAIDLEDLDYGFNPVIDYAVRGRAAENLRKQTIFDSYRQYAPDAPVEQLEAATELRYANDAEINKLTENPKADPDKIDTVGTQAKVAETLGIQRVDNNAKLTRGLNVRDSLDNAGVLNSGFNQYRRAQALSENFETPEQLFEAVRKSPAENGLGLTDITRERAAKIIERLDANLNKATDPAEQQALMANAIRALSKANIDEMLLRTNFTDPNLAKLVNGEYNRIAIGFNKAVNAGDKIGMGLRRVMNASMRGFNLNSALTELTDVVNAMHIYGKYAWSNLNPAGTNAVLERWGQSGIVARMDNPDKAVEVFDALSRGDKSALKRISDAANTVEEKLALYRYGENYKAALFLKSAEDYWNAVDPSLQGTALTGRILDEFDKNMLPLDHFTRVFKSDNQMTKLLTQYLDWNILNTRQQARNLVGANDSGIYRDMGRGGRIARNLATNLVPRIAVGMARGVPIVTTIGILDPFGFASQDYSGIQEEDKNGLDRVMEVAGVSPLLGLITSAYFNYRQDEETAEDYENGEMPEDNRGNWVERTGRNVQKMFTPYGGQIGSYDQLLRNFGIDFGESANGRGSQAVELMQKGYSENKNGRVQYLAPENPLDVARAWLMGKGQTQPGREYSGTPDIFSVMAGEASLADLFTSNPSVEAVTGQGDYLRPVSDNDFTIGKDGEGNAMTKNFNEMIKNAGSREEQEAILEQARAYNAVLDDFRKENPEGAEAYDQIMSNDDLVSPEYWKEIVGTNAEGSINLDIFKMIGDRKKELAKSLGAPYDPMYDLPDDQARALLQLKSTATGDDLALRNILYKSDWYNQYVDDRSAYYDQLPEATDNESRQSTERVKQWNVYDDQLNSLSMLNTPDLQRQFPYNAAYKAAEAEYEARTGNQFFGSPESDAWWSQYGQGKKAEDEALDAAKLEVINQMRVIEGFPPMTMEQYQQATEIADTSGGGSGGGGGGGQYDFVPEFYNSFRATDAPAVKIKAQEFNPNTGVGRRTNSKKNLGARSGGSSNGGYSL